MKRSITVKITCIFAALLVAVMAASVLLNYIFLEAVYKENKQKTLMKVFDMANYAATEGTLDDIETELRMSCNKSNITMVVLASDYSVLFSSGAESDMLQRRFMEVWFGGRENSKIIDQQDNYILEETSDQRTDGGYLILSGSLDNGSSVMMQIPLSSIEESASISRQFMVCIGVAVALIGTLVIFIVTRRITNPILQLSQLSQRMAELDFDAKYVPTGENEIDQLGQHMNELSEALEETISELKTANNEMQLDLDRKEQIDEMRKEFLSNVSHELKTPIALIQGYAEGLEEYADDEENRKFYTEVIIDEAQKMNLMVQKLLTLNQLEFGADEVVMERFDLLPLIKGVLNNMSILMQQENITLKFDRTEPCYVWADEFKVEEVFTNYMSNAIHHIDGDRIIEVKVVDMGNVVHVSVYNTGKQLPEEELKKLWDKFYKVDKSHSRQYGGSGIGLSIVKAIMDSFHQAFGVGNKDNGVEFWFELDTTKH